MRSLFAKILMLACLALVLGLKMLTLLNTGEALFIHSPRQQASSEIILAARHTHNTHEKHVSQAPEKRSLQQSVIFEDTTFDLKLKKDLRVELHRFFSSFAKFELSSRILAFHKSYCALLSVSEHHSPLYVLDHALLI